MTYTRGFTVILLTWVWWKLNCSLPPSGLFPNFAVSVFRCNSAGVCGHFAIRIHPSGPQTSDGAILDTKVTPQIHILSVKFLDQIILQAWLLFQQATWYMYIVWGDCMFSIHFHRHQHNDFCFPLQNSLCLTLTQGHDYGTDEEKNLLVCTIKWQPPIQSLQNLTL